MVAASSGPKAGLGWFWSTQGLGCLLFGYADGWILRGFW